MSEQDRERLRAIRTFPQLVKYLRDELDWPIETEDFETLYFEYEPDELGIDAKTAAKIEYIKQLRPLEDGQPWGIFFVKFVPKRLPVVAMRRILRGLAVRKRASANRAEQAAWNKSDLLFISAYGEDDERHINFAHFHETPNNGDLPILRVLGWDGSDTALHIDHVHSTLTGKLRWPPNPENINTWRQTWAEAFTLQHREVITTSKQMAIRLADLAAGIRKKINSLLVVERDTGPLHKLMNAFREALIHDMEEDDFADTYAQTVAYGLLTARISRPAGLTADNLADMVPITNPFLKKLMETFLHLGGRRKEFDFDELGINDVVEALRNANMEAVLRDFGDRNPAEDPVIHFYELFLKEYDAKKRMQRGVFYTPRPVVSYIVRSVHELLQTEFDLEDGLADTTTWGQMLQKHPDLKLPTIKVKKPNSLDMVDQPIDPDAPFVQILDPACGTGTFLVEAIDVIHKTMLAKWKKEGHLGLELPRLWDQYVPQHLLPRLHGYELLMAPYAIAHMKTGLRLYETGYKFGSHERARIYLTNALEPPQDFSDRLAFDAPALAHEAQAVNGIKNSQRFTVVIGNPPYSNFGQLNRSSFIVGLLNDYKRGLEEKKLNLDDDFIKFVRLAQHLIGESVCGVSGMITNNTFVDAPTRREMRHSLCCTFDMIRVIDLHGNSIERETCPDGSPDDNVFDIQQGVAISECVREAGRSGAGLCEVQHKDLYGHREVKYLWLLGHGAGDSHFSPVLISPPLYRFQPHDSDIAGEYNAFTSLTDIFMVSGSGVSTDRDDLCFDIDKCELTARMRKAFGGVYDEAFKQRYRIVDSSSYDLTRRLQVNRFDSNALRLCLYRLFDCRWLYYKRGFTSRPAWDVMQHLLQPNLGLLAKRQARDGAYDWFFAARGLVVNGLFSIDNKGREQIFPLYLYEDDESGQRAIGSEGRRLNLHRRFLSDVCAHLGLQPEGPFELPIGITPETIFHYIYGVFHSPEYRKRYAEFLKMAFPRLPLTSSLRLFTLLATLGGELVSLHVMDAPKHNNVIADWMGTVPSGVAATVSFSHNTVWISSAKNEGFRNVPTAVWEFRIGGHQVCEKWLKDRKGRQLSKDDIAHYQKIVVALSETIRIMTEIDKTIEAYGGWPGAFITDPKNLEGLQSKKA